MGFEGAVRLAYRRELEALANPVERQALFDQKLAELYDRGKGISAARCLEIDDVIDPAESRRWIIQGLRSVPARAVGQGKKRRNVDTW